MKISESKIAQISYLTSVKYPQCNYDDRKKLNARILHFSFKTETNARKILNDFTYDDFPKIKIIILEVLDETSHEIFKIFNGKFPLYENIFIQLYFCSVSTNIVKYYEKPNGSNIFEELIYEDLFIKRLKMSKRNTINNYKEFFYHVQCHENLITETDLSEILSTSKNEYLSALKKALSDKNELLIELLVLFVDELPSGVFESALGTYDVNIILIFLENFTLHLEWIDQILSHVKIEEILKEIDAKKLLVSLENILTIENFSHWCKIRDIFHKNNLHNFLYEVQNREINFYEHEKCTVNLLEEFHKNIESKNLEKVQDFVKNFLYFKILKFNGMTALEKSIDTNSFSIYSFLLSKDFLSDSIDKKIAHLSPTHKEKIFEENLKYLKENPENFLNFLWCKCELFGCSGLISYSDIRNMLQILSENLDLKQFLKIAALSDGKFIFDYKNESVVVIDPKTSERAMGLADMDKNIVYVGKNLNKFEQLGTFIHEVSHYIFHKIYNNHSKPYCKGDRVRADLWKNVKDVTFEKLKTFNEPIIRRAFKYPDNEQDAELAVRVNHMTALYSQTDPIKLQILRLFFSELFDFQSNFVMHDLKVLNLYRLIKLNNDFGVLKGIEDSMLRTIEYEKLFKLKSVTQNNKFILSPSDQKVLFSSNVPDMTISQILCEVFRTSINKLYLNTRNIYLDLNGFNQKTLKTELEILLAECEIERIFIKVEAFDDSCLNILLNLKTNSKLYFICHEDISKELSRKLKLKLKTIIHTWHDLTHDSKCNILNKSFKFQDVNLKFSEFYSVNDSIADDTFSILASNYEVKVNQNALKVFSSTYIERIIEKKKRLARKGDIKNFGFYAKDINDVAPNKMLVDFEEYTLELFLKSIEEEQVVLISDLPGSGKTTVLIKFQEYLVKEFPFHWISFVSLKDHFDQLSKGVGDSFIDFIIKILKLNSLEREVFTQKFLKGEVKIICDAFDEISPRCKQQTKKLFDLFRCQHQNQIFVSTRTHLENELEELFQTLAHRLKKISRKIQINFLVSMWEQSCSDDYYLRFCAEQLVDKIKEMTRATASVIGLPLILFALKDYFKERINENFFDLIQKLNLSTLYKHIAIQASIKVLRSKYPELTLQQDLHIDGVLKVHQCKALTYLFNKQFAIKLGHKYDERMWTLEEITRGGMIEYNSEGDFRFLHLTYAEYLIVDILERILSIEEDPTNYHFELITQILFNKKYFVTRIFWNQKFENFDSKDMAVFTSWGERFLNYLKICNLLKPFRHNVYSVFFDLINKGNFNIFLLFAIYFLKYDEINFTPSLESLNDSLIASKLPIEILDKFVQSKYFLNEKDKNSLDMMTQENFILKKWNDAMERCSYYYTLEALAKRSYHTQKHHELALSEAIGDKDKRKLQNILIARDTSGGSVLHWLINQGSYKTFVTFYDTIDRTIETGEKKSLVLDRNFNGENILLLSIRQRQIECYCFILKIILCKIFNNDFSSFLADTSNPCNGQNLIHYIASFGSSSIISATFGINYSTSIFFQELSSKSVQEMVLWKNRSIFLTWLLKKKLRVKSKYGYNVINYLARYNNDEDAVKNMLDVLLENLDSSEIKELLLNKYSLHYAIKFNQPIILKILVEFYEKNLTKSEYENIMTDDSLYKLANDQGYHFIDILINTKHFEVKK